MGKEADFNKWWYKNNVIGTGGSFNKNEFWNQRENRHFNMDCTRIFLFNVCCTMFKVNGLPEQDQPIDELYLNRLLITQGRALFYHEKETDQFRIQPYSPESRKNNYGYSPVRRVLRNFFGKTQKYDVTNSVEIWHNPSQFPMTVFIYEYCRKLQMFDEVIYNRLQLHKIPMTLNANGEQERLAANEVLRLFDEGLPAKVKGTRKVGDFFSVEEFDINYYITNLLKDKQTVLSEFLTWVGINTFAFEKKERVTNGEINQNEEMVKRCLSSYLITINNGLKMANKKWGLNMECELNLDYMGDMDLDVFGAESGGSSSSGSYSMEYDSRKEDDE